MVINKKSKEHDNRPDEPVYFAFSATLRITGNSLDFEAISGTLDLKPTHKHRAGEYGGPIIKLYEQDMWLYTVEVESSKSLEEHIQKLWSDIRPHTAYLRSLKSKCHVDVICGYRSNSDTAGFEVDYRCMGLFTELEVPFSVSVIIT